MLNYYVNNLPGKSPVCKYYFSICNLEALNKQQQFAALWCNLLFDASSDVHSETDNVMEDIFYNTVKAALEGVYNCGFFLPRRPYCRGDSLTDNENGTSA